MSAINKSFVVKNGLEISTDLIVANANTRKVGIGTTVSQYLLHVNGGIGVTDAYVSGIATVINQLRVGTGGTVFTVLGVGNSIGVGTANPAFLLDVRSPVSTGQTALYVQGDIQVTGDVRADDILITNLNVSGVSTFVGFATFNNILVVGIGTITTLNSTSGTITNLTGTSGTITNLNVTGISTLGTVRISSGIITAASGIVTYFGDGSNLTNILSGVGISSLGTLIGIGATILNFIGTAVSTVTVSSGIATIKLDAGAGGGGSPGGTNGQVQYNNFGVFGGSSNFTFDGSNVNVTGIATITTLNSTNATITNLTGTSATITNASGNVKIGIGTTALLVEGNARVTGILTVGSSSITLNGSTNVINVGTGLTLSSGGINVTGISTLNNANATQLSVTDISTFVNGPILVGTGTSTGTASQPLQVTGGAYVSGSVGIGTTTPTSKLHVVGDVRVSGIITATSFFGDGSGLTGAGAGIGSTGSINTSGIITATSFFGDGSGLTGAGIGSTGSINTSGIITATSFVGNLSDSLIKNYTEVISVIGNTSTAATLNLANGNVFTATLTGNCTFTFTTGVATGAASFTLVLLNDATSGRSIVWPASVKWPNNVIPVRTTAGNATDIWSFFTPNNGTTWYGNIALYNLT